MNGAEEEQNIYKNSSVVVECARMLQGSTMHPVYIYTSAI